MSNTFFREYLITIQSLHECEHIICRGVASSAKERRKQIGKRENGKRENDEEESGLTKCKSSGSSLCLCPECNVKEYLASTGVETQPGPEEAGWGAADSKQLIVETINITAMNTSHAQVFAKKTHIACFQEHGMSEGQLQTTKAAAHLYPRLFQKWRAIRRLPQWGMQGGCCLHIWSLCLPEFSLQGGRR